MKDTWNIYDAVYQTPQGNRDVFIAARNKREANIVGLLTLVCLIEGGKLDD